MKRLTGILLVLALGVVLCTGVSAQPLLENHYKVYNVSPPITYAGGLLLQDQFGSYNVGPLVLRKLANPVAKIHNGVLFPILFPEVHQTWWGLDLTGQGWVVEVENQFGVSVWHVGNPRFLVLPARKNQPGPPLIHNHYLAYEATGPGIFVPVQLDDQFGPSEQVVAEPVLFLNPVQKTTPNGVVYPIEDPEAHLACYRLQPVMPYNIQVLAWDQFGNWQQPWQIVVNDDCYLCVPSHKRTVVETEKTTWGDVKALYHQ
jgi:hypothetical protein